MEREKLILTKEQGCRAIYGNLKGFEIVKEEITDNTRWSIITEIVIKRISDGKFFAGGYSKGATECQDEQPFEYDEPDFNEVFPVEKKVIVYE